MSTEPGVLYIVATPIGNLQDLSPRVVEVLKGADVVLAEDTRSARKLFRHFDVRTALLPYHEHNEARRVPVLLERLKAGQTLALIAAAGTPLISDPGYRLVRAVQEAGSRLLTVPGPCAAIAGLAVSGIATDRFCFEGFLPARRGARRERLAALGDEPRTMIFYEAPHRAVACLADMVEAFGAGRTAAVARELTKIYEETRRGALSELHAWLVQKDRVRGEIVIVVAGASTGATDEHDTERLLGVLLAHLPPRQAVAVASEITGRPRNALYRLALRQSTAPSASRLSGS